MAVSSSHWPDYAAYPYRVMISPSSVPGGPWPLHPWLASNTLWREWEYQIMLMREWCHNNLRGPWVCLGMAGQPQIYTQLAEDHALVQLTWQ